MRFCKAVNLAMLPIKPKAKNYPFQCNYKHLIAASVIAAPCRAQNNLKE